MEKFRDTIQKELWGTLALVAAMIVIFRVLALIPVSSNLRIEQFVAGFASGFYMAVFGCAVAAAVRRARMLRSEKALHKCYVERNDERNRAIAEKVGGAATVAMFIALTLGAYATFAFGRFEASLALIAALACLTLVRLVAWAIFRRRI